MLTIKEKYKIYGISIALAKDCRLIYAKGYGYADTLKKEPVTQNNLFRIASCSKTITALGVMKLIEDNKINLHDMVFGEKRIINDSLYRNIADERVYSITAQNFLQ